MANLPQSVFGVRLRCARERAGLAQDRLGVSIGLDEGCSSARISRYETGIHQPPFEVAEKLAKVLGVPTSYFYCRDDRLAELLLELDALSDSEIESLRKSLRRLIAKRSMEKPRLR